MWLLLLSLLLLLLSLLLLLLLLVLSLLSLLLLSILLSLLLLFRPKKTQRLREEIALGQQTPHISSKTWPAINMETISKIAEKVELIITFKNAETVSPISWITEISGKTVTSENITTAHQQLVSERDRHINRYNTEVELAVAGV